MSTEFKHYDYTDVSGSDKEIAKERNISFVFITIISLSCIMFGAAIQSLLFSGMERTRGNIDKAETTIANMCGSGLTEQIKIITDNQKVMKEKYKTPYNSAYLNSRCIIPKK